LNKEYICYCGLYCENCAVKSKVEPAAKILHEEMQKAGFEDIIQFLPEGEGFWSFLKMISQKGACISCREGSVNPDCAIRICARKKDIEICALCKQYPCENFAGLLKTYSTLAEDNAVFRSEGPGEWSKMQDERRANNFAYKRAGF